MRKSRPTLTAALRKRKPRGATSTEYILILIGVVIPIALMLPLATRMIKDYGKQMTGTLQLPFP